MDETLGEDPFLIAKLGEAMVRGLQGSSDGSIDSDHVAATLKHFAGYGSTEGGRNRSPYPFGPRHLLDHDVAAFRKVIRNAQPAAVMAASKIEKVIDPESNLNQPKINSESIWN